MPKAFSIEYTVKNSKGEVIDSNKGNDSLTFIEGKGEIIPGLEKEVVKMKEGEEKEIVVKANEAYGERNEEWIETLPREQFEGIDLQKSMTLYGQSPDGQTVVVTVVDFDDKNVTIDYNHPLAGEDLTFEVKVVEKRDATLEELAGNEGHSCCGGGCHS